MCGASRRLTVATVQMPSVNGAIRENLDVARTSAETAAHRGATLVLLPELVTAVYVYDERIWAGAEPLHGPTLEWMLNQSAGLALYLVAGILEAHSSSAGCQ